MQLSVVHGAKDTLTSNGIRWIELDDHDGDDVLATLSTSAATAGRLVMCFSGDRDLFQLTAPAITILTPDRRRITPEAVLTRHRIAPTQWPDLHALTGDQADNIRGINGVEPNTAPARLAGGLHLDDMPHRDRLRSTREQRITRCWNQVLLWRDLIRLDTQVPVKPEPVTGRPTPKLPRAAAVLETINLW